MKLGVWAEIANATLRISEGAASRCDCFLARSVLGIAHPVGIDGKHGLGLWQAGRVIDFADPRLTSAFPQVQSANTRAVFANLD